MKSDIAHLLCGRLTRVLSLLIKIHLLGLSFLSFFRLVQYVALRGMVEHGEDSVLTAFIKGVWFDNVVGCYVLIVPLALLLIAGCFGYFARWLRCFALVWIGVLYVLCFAISAANIPYFAYFFQNINSGIFGWFGYAGTTVGMVAGESSYLVYISLWALTSLSFVLALVRMEHSLNAIMRVVNTDGGSSAPMQLLLRGLLTLSVIGLCMFGIRGRMGYNPIKVSQAYYCSDPLLNQLGIAPIFNLLTSVMDDMRKENTELQLMPYSEAIAEARKELGVEGTVDSTDVMRRHVEPDSTACAKRPNVVIILMESMSARLMQRFGHKEKLTPVLDSLYSHSMAFTRCYSAGVHTNHGLTATLYSFPALMKRNLMKGTVTPHREGIPTVLKEYGYHNLFFMTHEAQYDNMNAFFRTNGYDEVYAQEDYPRSEVVNSFGVSDGFLFRFALDKLQQIAFTHQPFMATLLTISNHPPYIIPDDFHPRSAEKDTQIVEYADYCLGRFLNEARKEAWYDNTLFVVLADHGKIVGQVDSELPQSYNHIPLLFFGRGVTPELNTSLATQVDVMPSLLGMLGMEYAYNGFGVNLMKTKRDKVFYSADNQIVARTDEVCFVHTQSTGLDSYFWEQPDGTLSATEPDTLMQQLRRYAYAMMQTAEYCYRHQK